MSPSSQYQQLLNSGELQPDAGQQQVVQLLQELHDHLLQHPEVLPAKTGFLKRLFSSPKAPVKVPGLYLWGGVGRGKTLLTDMFYSSVDIESKTRLHFHRFMRRIHLGMRELGDVEDPLALIADDWAQHSRLLVLDEMHVNDITDAMLMGRLLKHLFERGVTMVTTSNVHPDDLFKNGLQRDRFIPAIEQIKAHTVVHAMGGDTDYRLRVLSQANIYFDSAATDVDQQLQENFDKLSRNETVQHGDLPVNGRPIPVVASAETLVWFSFDALCNSPRSTHDYIEIATVFSTVILSEVPVLDDMRNDEARRLVNLIDEFYDRNVNLIVSAAASPEALYTGKRLAFEFVRAASRLREMQSLEYLSRHHMGSDGGSSTSQ